MRHEKFSGVGEALAFLDKMCRKASLSAPSNRNQAQNKKDNFKPVSEIKNGNEVNSSADGKTFVLNDVKSLKHPAMIEYITQERLIESAIAKNYLKEILFQKLNWREGLQPDQRKREKRNFSF